METYTTEPDLQVYSANGLKGMGKGGKPFVSRGGLCLETQHFPDSPTQLDFPTTTLNPGENFSSTTIYKFSIK